MVRCATWLSAGILAAFLTRPAVAASFSVDFDPQASYRFEGVVGERLEANREGWLLRTPAANPGLLAMFLLRDRQPPPQLVPWAGEFVGKYLISAVQAVRMDNDPRLPETVEAIVSELVASQADDGYLGPFPREQRLLTHWDLWGHYHVMLALMMWHERTGNDAALKAARRAADLACLIYLDTDRRPRDAGSSEMNLAIIHSLGRLYRLTAEEKYLRLMREIEKDWELEGDYFRTGLAGVEFYKTPKPRWESLHNLQGLVELYLITDDDRYRKALLHHWDSIRRLDRRNTGGFSSGEQATGTPYQPTAIETCCTIAWMALTVDALRLTADPLAADELELSTYNGMLGAQHPSGCWWTYNTPMDGIREASHHTIVFQSRAGTPDLNCCSVNAPRGLGMLSEWAVMRSSNVQTESNPSPAALWVNYYGPMEAHIAIAKDLQVTVRQETRYPLDGNIRIVVEVPRPATFPLRLRIPKWSKQSRVRIVGRNEAQASDTDTIPPAPQRRAGGPGDGSSVGESVQPGTYLTLDREWHSGDTIQLDLDMSLRYEPGAGEAAGKISLYRGPILLAYDVLLNDEAAGDPPPVTRQQIEAATISFPTSTSGDAAVGRFAPWIVVQIPREQGPPLRLCDFANAGSRGNRYLSWLPAEGLAPTPSNP